MFDVAYLEKFENEVKRLNLKWERLQDEEVKYSFPVPDASLKQCFNYWTEKHPDKPYVLIDDTVYTYKECNTASRRIANGLKKLGCKKGDRINTFMQNSLEFIIICQACFKLGIILVNSNPMDTPREIAYKMTDCSANVVVVDDTSVKTMMKALEDTGFRPDHIIYLSRDKRMETASIKNMRMVDYDVLLENDDTEPQVTVLCNDIQVLQYTGGTTGVIKGCGITNKGLLAVAMAVIAYLKPSVNPQDLSVLIALPMSHIYGFGMGITIPMAAGGSAILAAAQKPSIAGVLNAIEKYKPTCWPTVPVVLNSIKNDTALQDYNLSSVKAALCGSSPLPLETIEMFYKMYNINIREIYGLSEASGSLTGMSYKKGKIGSVGIPFPNTDILIVDAENGTEVLAAGEPGEIIARGPHIMKEYWNKPEETRNAIRNGWLYTGDIGVMDDEGILQIVDRKKDLIIVSGFNVYPREIDEVLYTHPDISEACTIGILDEKRGEVPKAFVVKKANSSICEEDLIEYCREYLSRFKVPKQIEFVDFIPKTKVLKPDRKAIKKWEQDVSVK